MGGETSTPRAYCRMKELRIDRDRAIRVAAMIALALIGVSVLPGLLRTPEAPEVPSDVGFLPTEQTTAGLGSGLGKIGARSGPKTGLTVRRGARTGNGGVAGRAGRNLDGKRTKKVSRGSADPPGKPDPPAPVPVRPSGPASTPADVTTATAPPASSPTAPASGSAPAPSPAPAPASAPPSATSATTQAHPVGGGSGPGRPPAGSGDGSEEFAPR